MTVTESPSVGDVVLQDARPNPFHAAGVTLPTHHPRTVDEVLSFAELDWKVERRTVYVADDQGIPVMDDDAEAIVRVDTGERLGLVVPDYQEVQNHEALGILEDLLGEVQVEAGIGIKGGRQIIVQARLPEAFTVGGDALATYLLLRWSHDGSTSIMADLTNLRFYCTNVLPSIRRGTLSRWTHRHSKNVLANAASAAEVLGLSRDFQKDQAAAISTLQSINVTDEAFWKIVSSEFPEPDDASDRVIETIGDRRELVGARYSNDLDGGSFRGTGWGVLNAFSSFDQWDARFASTSDPNLRRVQRVLDGTIGARVQRVTEKVLALA